MKMMIATCWTVGLADGIVDDTHALFLFIYLPWATVQLVTVKWRNYLNFQKKKQLALKSLIECWRQLPDFYYYDY